MNLASQLRYFSLFSKSFLVLLAVCMLLSIAATPIWAQATSSSSVVGQVTDQQGAAVPATQVTLIDNATNNQQVTTTNADGRYVFVNVPVGSYSLVFSKAGFETSRVADQQVEIGSNLTINSTLHVGATSTTVEVQAVVGAELQTTSAAIGTTITGQAIQALPNLGRDVTTLAVLQPGVTLGGYTAGADFDQNTYMLDGGNTSDDMAGNTIGYITNFTGMGGAQTSAVPSGVVPTPVESIEEFKVSTFNQTADFNNSIGSEVQMATKRGTNQFHGSGYFYYFATNVGAANSWVNDHTCNPATPADCQSIVTANGPGSFPLAGHANPLPSNHRDRFGSSLGGPMAPKFLGDKWYFFFNYEGFRFANVSTYERLVPTAAMREGIIQVPNSSGVYVPYNLNPYPVAFNGTMLAPAQCGASLCDPRGLGLNPVVNQIWQKYMPLPNDLSYGSGDGYNTAGYVSSIRAPLTTDTYVSRIDHNFGDKWHFMTSYRYMNFESLTTNQVDIGGAFAGDTLGTPVATAPRPQKPSYYVAGLTTNITPNLINDFHFSYLRNFWQWSVNSDAPQLPGLAGAVEIANGSGGTAESTNALIPYNVNTQSTRQRFWDGHDSQFRDDITLIKGNHLLQFGGSYQHNFDYHSRTDNGNGVNNQTVYQVTGSGISFPSSVIPSTVPNAQLSAYENLYSEVLGLVGTSQVAYTRAGSNLQLQPLGSAAFDKDVIPYYQEYFGDTWHLKPNVTLSYSLGYTIEMPPYELNGKQVEQVDANGNLITTANYLADRVNAALAGQAYDPTLGFELVRDVGSGLKYPYNPFYGEFSPRVSVAWNPKFDSGILGTLLGNGKTVLRGGYGRIWGRLNGVNQVLVPLLGPGLLQPVQCIDPTTAGACTGANGSTPTTAFRIGPDGNTAPLPAASQTLPQPFYPGVNGAVAGDTTALDPNYKPERTDNFDFTIQRELTNKMTLEVGYTGRIIRNEYMEINLDAVPYMTTLGGQSFAQAYAALYTELFNINTGNSTGLSANSVQAQPFFEAALGGSTSAFCKAYTSCSAAVASLYTTYFQNTRVSDLWHALNNASTWTLGRTMISSPIGTNAYQATSMSMVTSLGWGNYNALFATWRARDWHGLTAISNFTWGRALGTGTIAQYNSAETSLNPYNLASTYGPNPFDIRFTYNLAMSYAVPYYKTQHGIVGHILGGWTIAPLFTAQSGAPIGVTYSESSCTACQAFGEATPPASVSTVEENAVGTGVPYTGGNSANNNVVGSNGIATNNPTGANMFSNPAAVYAEFRRCILGIDSSCGGSGNLRGLPTWNLDGSAIKDIGIWKEGRVGASLSFQITNVLNHFQPANPSSLLLTSPTTFGRITGASNTPRNMEFGLRIHF